MAVCAFFPPPPPSTPTTIELVGDPAGHSRNPNSAWVQAKKRERGGIAGGNLRCQDTCLGWKPSCLSIQHARTLQCIRSKLGRKESGAPSPREGGLIKMSRSIPNQPNPTLIPSDQIIMEASRTQNQKHMDMSVWLLSTQSPPHERTNRPLHYCCNICETVVFRLSATGVLFCQCTPRVVPPSERY